MSEQTQPPLILCALHTTRLLRVWIIKVHLKLWNASTPPSPRHLLHNSAVWKHFGSPLPRPFSPHSGISLDFSSPLFPQGMDAEGGEGASCSINSCSICRACGWGSGRRLEFGTVCGVYAWGLSPDSAWMGAQGRGPPTSLRFCAISIFGTVIAHWRVWIFIYVCVCVWERWEASIVSFHRRQGHLVPRTNGALSGYLGCFIYKGQTPSLWAHLSLISALFRFPLLREKVWNRAIKGDIWDSGTVDIILPARHWRSSGSVCASEISINCPFRTLKSVFVFGLWKTMLVIQGTIGLLTNQNWFPGLVFLMHFVLYD